MKIQQLTRRGLLLGLLALGAQAGLPARAQDKPLEWVIGYAAGGGSDVLARTVAIELQKQLGRTIVPSNKPGAATNIAAAYTANSKDYGNLIFTADFATLAANPWLFPKLPFDPIKDFAPVSMLARFPLLLVVPADNPAKNFQEFVAWARTQPEVGYGSAGTGSAHHLAGELLRERTGLKLTHIAYKGAAPAMADLMGGQIPAGVIDAASAQQALASGKVRALGVASLERLANFPDIPTLHEQGLQGFEAYAWQGVVVPAGTSKADINKFNQALQVALKSDSVQAKFKTMGLEAFPSTPQQMADYVKAEHKRWGQVIKSAGIKLE